jgi:hypothetical protein
MVNEIDTDEMVRKEIPAPAPMISCDGVSDPPTELKTPCYKCVIQEQSRVKQDNTQDVADKMRERTGAGNDNYMKSLTIGDNFDENGRFICNKPENFVNLDLLGKQPWNLIEHFEKVGKTRDHFGHIIDRPDITAEQKTLQYQSIVCIAQRNASLMAHEIGSLNSAYTGMTGQIIPQFEPASPASTIESPSVRSTFSFSTTSDKAGSSDTPLTEVFADNTADIKEDRNDVAVGTVAY